MLVDALDPSVTVCRMRPTVLVPYEAAMVLVDAVVRARSIEFTTCDVFFLSTRADLDLEELSFKFA